MKTATPALIAFINSRNVFFVADLFEFALADGVTFLRYTTTDFPVVYPATGTVITPGTTFLPLVATSRDGVQWTRDLSVQSLRVSLLVNETVTYGTPPKPLAQAAAEGVFDGARVKLYRAFFDENLALVDILEHFEGTVGQVQPTSSEIALTVKSELDRLNIKLPRNQYSPGCSHAFLDQGCDPNPPGTLRASVTSTGALIGTPTTTLLTISGTQAADFYQLGVILMTSGTEAGQRRAVRSSVNGGGGHQLTLSVPFATAPLAADTYSLTRGCMRTQAACTAYGNLPRFRGFPYVPRPEDVMR